MKFLLILPLVIRPETADLFVLFEKLHFCAKCVARKELLRSERSALLLKPILRSSLFLLQKVKSPQ